MKKYILPLFLVFSQLAWSQSTEAGKITNVDFAVLNDKISISYEFEQAKPADRFDVWLEIRFKNGKKHTPQKLIGATGLQVAGGKKQVVWDYKAEGIIIEEEISVIVYAVKLPSAKLGKGLAYSSVLPGTGHKAVGAEKNAAWLGGLGYTSVASALLFNYLSNQAVESYQTELDIEQSAALHTKANNFYTYSLIAAGTAAAVWITDYVIVSSKYKKAKKLTPDVLRLSPENILTAESPRKKISTRGLPPILFADLNFSDSNGNGILEAGEQGQITVKITNSGNGDAVKLEVVLKDSIFNPNIFVRGIQEINLLKPGETKTVVFPITTNKELLTGKHKYEILVKEAYGYDMDPAYLRLPTYAFQAPKFSVSGYEIMDFGEGTTAVQADGQLQLGESVKVKLSFQNIGQGAGTEVLYQITCDDSNVFLNASTDKISNIASGEVKTVQFMLSPNKRVNVTDGKIKLMLKISESSGKGSYNEPLYIALNQKAPKVNIVNVQADISSLQKDIALFVTDSRKFTANVGNIIDIKTVPQSLSKRPQALGVVLGVSRYESLAPAPYADSDAQIMNEYFKKIFGIENTISLTNQDVTISRMKKIFTSEAYGELSKNITADSSEIFVFFSGHGIPDKLGENVYLFPADGEVLNLQEFAYNLQTLYTNLNAMPAKHITLFIDACFSGFSKHSRKIQPENLIAQKGVKVKPINFWTNNPKFTVYTSSTGEETSLGFDATQTGLFTYFACAGLQGAADTNADKAITAGELHEYILKNTKETSLKIGGLQTPTFSGNPNRILVQF